MAEHSHADLQKFLEDIGQIVKMPIDKPEAIVKVLRDSTAAEGRFLEWAQRYLDVVQGRVWPDLGDGIKTELLARDEEVKRLRAALSKIANWNMSEAYANLPAWVMRSLAKEALAVGEEVNHG